MFTWTEIALEPKWLRMVLEEHPVSNGNVWRLEDRLVVVRRS